MLVISVGRGQDKLRKSALKKCNVRIRLISKNFYHRNIRFLGATRSKVISHRVGSSSSWSVVLCPLKPTFWWQKFFEINRVHTLHFCNTLFRTLSWPRSTKSTYIFVYNNACHLCRSGPGETSKKCIEKVQCTDSGEFKKCLPLEHPVS